jgi:hypothetical protein
MVDLENLKKITMELAQDLRDDDESILKLKLDTKQRKFTLDILQVVLDNLDEFAFLVNNKAEVILMNKKLSEDLNNLKIKCNVGDCWYNIFGGKELSTFPIQNSFKNREIQVGTWVSPLKFTYRYICIPLKYNGVSAVLGLATRI